MVSKLLLAVQECYFAAIERGEDQALVQRIGGYYFRVRAGLSYNKSPEEYGAFPCDPYSHTPGHAGAQQPGMTGQVKEEVITRFGELGIQVRSGRIVFNPALLVRGEFNLSPRTYRYRDVLGDEHELALDSDELAFSFCQVPVRLRLASLPGARLILRAVRATGEVHQAEGDALPVEISEQIFGRTGAIRSIEIELPARLLFQDQG
jgi:hypothetical protein